MPPLSKGGGTECLRVLTGTVSNLIDTPTNPNRTILKIINTNKQEPIKANITQNTVANTIEIRVTYTKNGIREILDEYGDTTELTKMDGIVLAKTKYALASGTHSFTVIDNKENKQNLSITINANSIYKVTYIAKIDNIDNLTTYTKTQETKTENEEQLITQLIDKNNSLTYSRAIQSGGNYITAINEKSRSNGDKEYFVYNKYYCARYCKYSYVEGSSYTCVRRIDSQIRRYPYAYNYMSFDESTGVAKLTSRKLITSGAGYSLAAPPTSIDKVASIPTTGESLPGATFYKLSFIESKYENVSSFVSGECKAYYYNCTPYIVSLDEEYYAKGDFDSYVIGYYNSFEDDKADENNEWWFTKEEMLPKFTLHKYDSNLNLQSTYDVDTKTLTTVPIDISNRGHNKIKLTLTASGTDYKTYISSDNSNWQEVTDITSGEAKELNVDGFNNLYIKIETNTSTINNIDVAYYKN